MEEAIERQQVAESALAAAGLTHANEMKKASEEQGGQPMGPHGTPWDPMGPPTHT